MKRNDEVYAGLFTRTEGHNRSTSVEILSKGNDVEIAVAYSYRMPIAAVVYDVRHAFLNVHIVKNPRVSVTTTRHLGLVWRATHEAPNTNIIECSRIIRGFRNTVQVVYGDEK